MTQRYQDNFKLITGVFLSCLILAVAIIPKISTEQCHCREKKTTTSQKAECPFGQLRGIAAALGVGDVAVVFSAPDIEWLEFSFLYLQPSAELRFDLAVAARAPPAFG